VPDWVALAIGFVLPRSCGPAIVVVEPAEHWQRYDVARIHAHHPRLRNRDPLTDALVGARGIEISVRELVEEATLSQNDHVIQTFLPDVFRRGGLKRSAHLGLRATRHSPSSPAST
jgi:hypothetical protein